MLMVLCPDAAARWFVLVYGLGVTTMLTVSATYHSGRFSPSVTATLRRVDHSTILFAIAGSYTALAGLSLTGTRRVVLLAVVWAASIGGVVLRMAWLDAPRLLTALVYLVAGWTVVIDFPGLVGALTGTELALVAGGGVVYSLGGLVYARRRPDPWPHTFGYHEVFHSLVTLAAAAHLAAVASLVVRR